MNVEHKFPVHRMLTLEGNLFNAFGYNVEHWMLKIIIYCICEIPQNWLSIFSIQ